MSESDNNGNLQGAFGEKGTQVNVMSYGHPYGERIIEEAIEVIRESESGRLLLKLLDFKKVPVQIIKGIGTSGFSPELMTIYIQVTGKVKNATPEIIIHLVKALHEAAQELSGFKTPDPKKDIMTYASFIHGRNLDSITELCQIIKELQNSDHYSILLDTMEKLGFNGVYKAYLKGASRDELYQEYAEAYEEQLGGSKA